MTIAILGPEESESLEFITVRLHPVGTKARGWGWEPDTHAAIEWLEARVAAGMKVCDVGTGTGILALVAARLGAKVTAYESDDAVRKIAAQNIKLNKLKVKLLGEYDGASDFDLVVVNLGNVDYAAMGILDAGKDVWTSG